MNQAEINALKLSLMQQKEIRMCINCTQLCNTYFKDQLINEDKRCLQNCGYNYMFIMTNIPKIMKDIYSSNLQ